MNRRQGDPILKTLSLQDIIFALDNMSNLKREDEFRHDKLWVNKDDIISMIDETQELGANETKMFLEKLRLELTK